jgi:hypothetical protein
MRMGLRGFWFGLMGGETGADFAAGVVNSLSDEERW